MSKVSRRHHSPPPAAPPKPKTVQLPPRVQNAPRNVAQTFNRLDRNNDKVIDFQDFQRNGVTAKEHRPAIPGKDKDGRITKDEFVDYARQLAKNENIKIPVKAGGSDKKPTDREHRIEGGTVFEVPKRRASSSTEASPGAVNLKTPQGATFRTDPSGLVIGRLTPGDRFVATHKKGAWYYGYVNGDPKQKGWVMNGAGIDKAKATASEQKLIKNPPEREPKHMVRDNGVARGPDGRNTDGFVTSGEKRYNAVLRDLESRFEVDQKTGRLGYTQALPLQRDAKLLADLDGKPLLNSDGQQITLPAGSQVGFRYTPDGEHAIVRLNRGKSSGLWAVLKMEDINWNAVDRSKVPGATTPKKPID
ncbi:MAG TPA: EF-hand domain-containing protein [Hyalangium sp.]|nr:EF-hand domain-containing protein [Hyalangium sp.]